MQEAPWKSAKGWGEEKELVPSSLTVLRGSPGPDSRHTTEGLVRTGKLELEEGVFCANRQPLRSTVMPEKVLERSRRTPPDALKVLLVKTEASMERVGMLTEVEMTMGAAKLAVVSTVTLEKEKAPVVRSLKKGEPTMMAPVRGLAGEDALEAVAAAASWQSEMRMFLSTISPPYCLALRHGPLQWLQEKESTVEM